MPRFRIIPILLIDDDGLVKGEKFQHHRYVGDPINAVKIFNDKEVDEITILDIGASRNKRVPNFDLIEELAGEAFMPLSYGGGLQSIEQVSRILKSGVEKVVFNYGAVHKPQIIRETADKFGSSSTVVSIDVKTSGIFGGKKVVTLNGKESVGKDPVSFAKEMEALGAGELVLTSIDREGTQSGYDLKLIEQVTDSVNIPVIVNGGAGNMEHFREAIHAGASAVAAGTFFVFQGARKAVLISYPLPEEIKKIYS